MSKAGETIRKILPTVLTVLGSGATIAAVIFAAKEGPKYEKILNENPEMKTKDKVITAVKVFGPAIGCATVSVASGLGAHCLDLKTQANITGMYVAGQQALKKVREEYKKYRLKNGEINGEEADISVRESIEEEKIPEGQSFINPDTGEKKVHAILVDFALDCPKIEFTTTKFELANAVVRINRYLDMIGSITLLDAIGCFGIEPKDFGIDTSYALSTGWSYESIYDDVDDRFVSSWLDFRYDCSADGTYVVTPICMARRDFEMCSI